jgi:hypothetical protein
MQKRLTACVLAMLSIICGAAFDQLTPAQKIDSVATLLKSLETRDLRPLAYIDSNTYTQHNLQVADGPAGVRNGQASALRDDRSFHGMQTRLALAE